MFRYLPAVAAVLVLTASQAKPAMAAGELDGTTWTAPIDETGQKNDTLSFAKGSFTSSECQPYGYKSGAYKTKSQSGAINWTSVQKNEQGDTMSWKGSWDGKSDQMTGSFVRQDANGKKYDPQNWTAKKKV
jgi:hypothetical protein